MAAYTLTTPVASQNLTTPVASQNLTTPLLTQMLTTPLLVERVTAPIISARHTFLLLTQLQSLICEVDVMIRCPDNDCIRSMGKPKLQFLTWLSHDFRPMIGGYKHSSHHPPLYTALVSRINTIEGKTQIKLMEFKPIGLDAPSDHEIVNVDSLDSRANVEPKDSRELFNTYGHPTVHHTHVRGKDFSTNDSTVNCSRNDCQVFHGSYDNGGNFGIHDSHKDVASLFYGTHETQVSEGGEAALHKHYKRCEKNPGHKQFIPVNDFNIKYLPEGYHDNKLVDFIKATADITVRLDVKMISSMRPMYWPDTKQPYAFYNMRGSDVLRVGTGFVYRVDIWSEEYNKNFDNGHCQCRKCLHSDTPSKVWGKVRINTAKHVIFDDLEAGHSTCRLFYDSQDSPIVTLDGWRQESVRVVPNVGIILPPRPFVEKEEFEVDYCHEPISVNVSTMKGRRRVLRYDTYCRLVNAFPTNEDWTVVDYVTCDVDVLKKLYKMWQKWWDLWTPIENKYKHSRDENMFMFLVSHPHGCSKQISLGHWTKRQVVKKYLEESKVTRYTYTTSTCPGSSGAHVHRLGYFCANYLDSSIHVHCGVNSEGENYCGSGVDFK